jgi:hypothetical protein
MSWPLVAAGEQAQRPGDAVRGLDVEVVRAETRQWIRYRYGDRVLVIKVVPDSGTPYYLVPTTDCTADADREHCTGWRRVRWVTAPF